MALKGKKQTPDHVAKRTASMLETRAMWSEEKRAEVNKKVGLAKVGSIPWNKGNNWKNEISPEELREINKERAREYRKNNPKLRIHERIGALIRLSLKDKNGRSWESILGYTTNELMIHLESQFIEGMNWDNTGEWHIDHIVPRSAFIFEDEHDIGFKYCWNLSNLRPLWESDNLNKYTKITDEVIEYINKNNIPFSVLSDKVTRNIVNTVFSC